MKRSFITAIAASALALSALTTAPAMAMTTDDYNMQSISYADLDLNTEAGARTMLHRINRAARDVCGDRSGMGFSERMMVRTCMRETTMRTVAQFDHPMVTALYEGRTPTTMVLAAR